MLANGVEQSDVFSDLLAQDGQLLQVSYSGSRFRPDQAVDDIADWLVEHQAKYHYRHIVFVGASLGGLLAYDIYQELLSRGWSMESFQFVVIDSSVGHGDLKSPSSWQSSLLNILRLGAPFNWLKDAKGYPVSYMADEVRYFSEHNQLREGSLEGVQVICVKSTQDQFVKDSVIDSWRVAAGSKMEVLRVDSPHVGFHEEQQTWKSVFENDILPRLR